MPEPEHEGSSRIPVYYNKSQSINMENLPVTFEKRGSDGSMFKKLAQFTRTCRPLKIRKINNLIK